MSTVLFPLAVLLTVTLLLVVKFLVAKTVALEVRFFETLAVIFLVALTFTWAVELAKRWMLLFAVLFYWAVEFIETFLVKLAVILAVELDCW